MYHDYDHDKLPANQNVKQETQLVASRQNGPVVQF